MITITDSKNIALHEFFQFRCSRQWIGAGMLLSLFTYMLTRWKSHRVPTFASLGTMGIAGTAYATLIEPRRPVLERVTVRIPTLPPALDGLRLGCLSDMHLDFPHTLANTRWAVQRMAEEEPDLIALTGDFVSFSRAISLLPNLLRSLYAPLGVYAVPGNHDHWEGVEDIRRALQSVGIPMLINENRPMQWHGADFWLAGVDDAWYGQPDLDTALADIPDNACTFLLSHSPDYADIASHHHIAFQLSGHTHGGHLHLPLLGWFCVPYHGIRYISGLETVGTMKLYVTRGLGGLPMRMNCPPEATIITLRSGK